MEHQIEIVLKKGEKINQVIFYRYGFILRNTETNASILSNNIHSMNENRFFVLSVDFLDSSILIKYRKRRLFDIFKVPICTYKISN